MATTTSASSFDFFKQEQQYSYEISPETILHIDRVSHSAACMYFTDNKGHKIAIPENVSVYTFDYQNTKRRVSLEPIYGAYMLCWTENYEIEWNGEIKMVCKSQRKWDFTTG